ncbi:hypothetical protein ONZ45_g19024 [Pleurotus djamor]|nr:hypothetical protein ONZ45_g19024 [Pleurotus djamor]
MIFKFRRDDARFFWFNATAISWLHVTAVICLATSSLWSHIDLGFDKQARDIANVFIQQSKTAPLTLTVALTPTQDGLTAKELFLDIVSTRRIGQVRLLMDSVDSETMCNLLDRRSSICAPYLRSFVFLSGRSTTFPSEYLWPEMPALRQLVINLISPPLELPRLPNLRSLHIMLPRPSAITPLQTLSILQGTPLIEEVTIHHLSSTAPSHSRASSLCEFPHIKLSHLKTLELSMDSFNPLRCFEFLTFPSSTTITVSLSYRSAAPDSKEQYILPNFLRCLSATSFKHAKFSVTCDSFKSVQLSDNMLETPTPRLTISSVPFKLLLPCIPALGLEHVTLERITDWGDFLPYINTIKSLTLVDCRLNVFDTIQPAKNSHKPPTLPNLEKLVLLGYNFSGGKIQSDATRNEHHKLSNLLRSQAISVKIEDGSATPAARKYLSKLDARIEWVNVDLSGKDS